MPSSFRLSSFVFLAVTALAGAAGASQAAFDAQAELDAIRQLAGQSPRQALVRIVAAQAMLGAGASYDMRQKLLRMEVWLREDFGELDAAYAAERKVLQLAIANKDPATAARARLAEVRQLLDQNRLDDAQARLDTILAQVPQDAPVMVKVSMERTRGDVFNARARFDKALAAYLQALRLLQNVPDAGEPRAMLYSRVAQVYTNSDNPAKAVETTRQGLAEVGIPVQTRGALEFTQGIAMIRLGRDAEGIAAFDKALQTAERAGLIAMEAAVRGNIPDYYLRHRDYVRAEHESRKALIASSKVKDENVKLMARANLGFALMGQGRTAEGLPYVDGVIADLRKAKATADLEAMLDEKGRMLERAGKYQHALAIVREQQSLQQQSARTARDRAIASLQEEFDANRRSQQIALLQRENGLKDAELGSRRMAQLATTFAAILTVLAGTVVFVLYRRSARSNAQLKELNTQLEFRSTHDALTGLHNRRSLTTRMNVRAEDGKQDRRNTARNGVDCFVLMDIDHFKSINDRWGHGAGDTVLVEVARRLTAAVRDTDMVVRWGGEEFMVYAPGTDPGSIAGMAGRILGAVGAAPVDAGNCTIPVTVTAGIFSLAPGAVDEADWHSAVRLADWALYQGKTGGRNQARLVTRLYAPAETVLATLESGSGDASFDALLELECVHGPRQELERPGQCETRAAGGPHPMAGLLNA
jgi:diguanylate cyclase (GGDEF)-like protein